MTESHDRRIERLLRNHRVIRVIGFDDAPFQRHGENPVHVAGVVCATDRFEGMIWDQVEPDGFDATDVLAARVESSKFHDQLHAIFLDGIALGGFNVVDVPTLSERLDLPVLTVIRRRPDWTAIEAALNNVARPEEKLAAMKRAGEVHQGDHIFFQTFALSPEPARKLLRRTTREGHIPEPIRLAHLIARAVVTGESGRRA